MEKPLWKPDENRMRQSNLTAFIEQVNREYGCNFSQYSELYQWSVENTADFWETMWEYGPVLCSQPYKRVVNSLETMQGCRWFEGARLNFAENLLRYRDERTALVFKGEGQETQRITYADLYRQTARLRSVMLNLGIAAGDRIAGFMPNRIETIVAMLAATSIGAIWSSCSPDFGLQGALDRFSQIEPRLLFTATGYYYLGREFDSLGKARELSRLIPSIEKVVVVPYALADSELSGLPGAETYQDFLASGRDEEIEFTQLPFDHPVYILYSSGTTGSPKCIVHGAGGTLLQHLKELKLHTDLKREDHIFYFTTCGWMMWNWLVSALAVGATLILYDGSPFHPDPGALFQLAQDEQITVFGTSARYLSALEQSGARPVQSYQLDRLKSILSTGSPLSDENFSYVYRYVKEDLCLSSISGGTDIISCFALGNPLLPVYSGQLQCRGLGMKVEVFNEKAEPVINQKGELVCTAPFPSMPVYFWNDPDGKKYHNAYFNIFSNIWHHGDYAELTGTGGMMIYGRSDATLNPAGVRIGTAEIYRLLEGFPQVADSLVVGQKWQGDERVVLFVKMAPGEELTDELSTLIKKEIREHTTPRHVPAKIIPILDIPYTINGKKVEIAVRKILHREEVTNREALANPEALDLYANLADLQV